ncbi:cadherin-15-like [Synchiropus splendidus]|uniref:cadherin-15-like n=1 Tax=Synchiropus splendidus TaxID=270530 RepID=UPI00237D8D6B|nr:cadherin-15-like [Synchiropus splendidus]
MEPRLLMACVMAALLCGVWSLDAKIMNPWPKATGRVKRDWIIPQIKVLENSKHVPEHLVQVKSDKIVQGKGLYKLEGPGIDQEPKNLFEIDEKNGVIWSKQPLDREKYQNFTLKVYALSPSGELLETPTTIEIVVVDMNDNRPAFTQKEFSGSVPELSVPGTSVMTVSATDADDPNSYHASLSYSIISQESIPDNAMKKTMFGINNSTGVIYTRDVGLEREVVKAFRLGLRVADMAGDGLTSEAVAVIHVIDINNYAPKIIPSMYHMTAVENREVAELGRVNVTDGDEPGTGNWEAKFFISNDPRGYFAIRTDAETNQGILSVVKPLDFEAQKEHKLTLRVENINPLSSKAPNFPVSTATVIIYVVNENEAPYLTENPIHIVVPENVAPGTSLKNNIAFDPENLGMSFEVTKDPENWLEINKHTGEISAKRSFNMRSPHVKNKIYTAGVKVTDADGVSSTAAVHITLVETNDFAPRLYPLAGSICKNRDQFSSGLVLTAVDEDLPPHAAPFLFEIPEEMSVNWTMAQINNTHAVLQPEVDLPQGLYTVPVLVSDHGRPTLSSFAEVNVTLCVCDFFGDCKSEAAALLGSTVGIGFIAIIIIGMSGLLVLLLLLAAGLRTTGKRRRMKKGKGLLVDDSEDDLRGNVFNYDEQGGGEEDENAFNINLLCNPNDVLMAPGNFGPMYNCPRGEQPIRRDAPHHLPAPTYPCRPPADPTNIEDFIDKGREAADKDPNVPPYDTALIYKFEGDGSVAGSLSSIASSSTDDDQDYDYLNDWGPRFQKLADMYGPR